MDLVDFSAERFAEIEAELGDLAERLGLHDARAIPISALQGDNVVDARPTSMPWYEGPTLLEHLEAIEIAADRNLEDRRFAGAVGDPADVGRPPRLPRLRGRRSRAAIWRAGDEVVVLPSGRRSRVAAVETLDGPLEAAIPPQSVTIRLEDDLDVGRGDMLADPERPPIVARELTAELCWMSERPLEPRRAARGQAHDARRRARSSTSSSRSSTCTRSRTGSAPERLELNDLGVVRLRLAEPLAVDPYARNRATGAFILIDEATNDTVAAGMVLEAS